METTVSFSGGQNSDISKQLHSKDSYLQALNFRPLTEIGGSNGSLVNIKGNECKITFPNLQPIYKLELIAGTLNTLNSLALTINGVTYNTNINNSSTGEDLYKFIITKFQNCYSYTGNTVATKTFDVAYDDTFIVIYQQPVYQDCSPVASITSTITTTFGTTDGSQALLYFINAGPGNLGPSLIQDTAYPYVKSILSNSIIPIGSTFILNDIYILTAPNDMTYGPAGVNNEKPAHDELTYVGAIWKLNIDDISKQHTLTLLYSNNLDFTKYHPIPPSAISGRYESVDIKRIYWSDNYNKIRTLNTAMPQLMALNPSQLSVIPKIEFVQPTLSSIGAGNLDAGCYQMAYRLSKVLGSVTNYSELSFPVYLTANAESTVFENYEGALGASSKSITWNISNLDTTYDQVEIIVAYRTSDSGIPSITSMGLQPITEVMNITYSDASTASYTEVTLEEFLLFNGTFTHAKTVDTKDNRLFWGNVRAPRKELENYDARAFRANGTGNVLLTNNGVNSSFSFTAAKNSPQTWDTINEYYLASNGDYSPNACYLKPPTATSTKILGGEGVNISYEFGTQLIQLDNNAAIAGSTLEGWDLETFVIGSPYRRTIVETSPINLVYNYPQNSKYSALKQPERTSLLKGFQHEEIYRFGIQFFDKQSNPYFTKWIGDIKMPSYGDYNNNSGYPGINDFRLSIYGPNNDIYGQILYIKFTVNIGLIQDLISGYQIVRVKRENTDKTIWGVGMINPMVSLNADDLGADAVLPASWDSQTAVFTWLLLGISTPARHYNPYPSQEAAETLNLNNDDSTTPNFARFKTFDCFDFDIGNRPSFGSHDKILIRSRLKSINYRDGAVGGYRQWFGKDNDFSGNYIPGTTSPIDDGTGGVFTTKSNNDNTHQPFFLMKMVDDVLYNDYTDFITSNTNNNNYSLIHTEYIPGNDVINYSGYTIHNKGLDKNGTTNSPCGGKQTLFTVIGGSVGGASSNLFTTDYGCRNDSIPFYKLLALYYKPNSSQYGGATYSSRSNNEYISCGEYVPVTQNGLPINTPSLTFKTFGGDIFTSIYDMQKTYQADLASGAEYYVYDWSSTPLFLPFKPAKAYFKTSFFFPSTGVYNPEVRLGFHPNRSIVDEGGYAEDEYHYNTYNNAENDIKTYFPKPLNFQSADEWLNRIYWSEIKFNNETQDSWTEYLTDSFYDVEGNYGGINALVSLKENMYYLQERGVGSLMINPVSLINDSLGQPVKLGGIALNSPVIQKHYYKAIDVGTSHQWSVYRSQSTITFVDVRHKKIYLFNGESVIPISDVKGQRNFVIKRLHNELLKFDNPVIDKGILVTYDYYHNEFLYTFNNIKAIIIDGVYMLDYYNNENLTLAYSEITDNFTGVYSFTPNLYINSNKYLISTNRDNKLWFHNYGSYFTFYNTLFPSLLKLIVNDNPLYTKVFDNYVWNSESIKDNIEWNDDLNIYPGSPIIPAYPDDVNNQLDTFTRIRCYNDWQNTDWVLLTNTIPGANITRKERDFNVQVPRNKFNYDTTLPSTNSLFNPANLTKIIFGERIRDKYVIVDLYYPNTINNRFIIHNFKSLYRISPR